MQAERIRLRQHRAAVVVAGGASERAALLLQLEPDALAVLVEDDDQFGLLASAEGPSVLNAPGASSRRGRSALVARGSLTTSTSGPERTRTYPCSTRGR